MQLTLPAAAADHTQPQQQQQRPSGRKQQRQQQQHPEVLDMLLNGKPLMCLAFSDMVVSRVAVWVGGVCAGITCNGVLSCVCLVMSGPVQWRERVFYHHAHKPHAPWSHLCIALCQLSVCASGAFVAVCVADEGGGAPASGSACSPALSTAQHAVPTTAGLCSTSARRQQLWQRQQAVMLLALSFRRCGCVSSVCWVVDIAWVGARTSVRSRCSCVEVCD